MAQRVRIGRLQDGAGIAIDDDGSESGVVAGDSGDMALRLALVPPAGIRRIDREGDGNADGDKPQYAHTKGARRSKRCAKHGLPRQIGLIPPPVRLNYARHPGGSSQFVVGLSALSTEGNLISPFWLRACAHAVFLPRGHHATMQGIKVGRPGCQTVKQILRRIPEFEANAGNCALHAFLDRIVHCGIDAG